MSLYFQCLMFVDHALFGDAAPGNRATGNQRETVLTIVPTIVLARGVIQPCFWSDCPRFWMLKFSMSDAHAAGLMLAPSLAELNGRAGSAAASLAGRADEPTS